ncbi:hypothetical protein CDD80_2403 [Ophiocordyceps camponoti-rufipedis]|uniref:Uncharacterized protein n=1 Tax=Ophiocordyceps camponoti-rufipedis TaxID=2004952 RepID=A0A2C5Z5W5_9HYPO|nr:hypothetical protein CDD80_2403 [Ophiocordyceps camponoti-rufipedis]
MSASADDSMRSSPGALSAADTSASESNIVGTVAGLAVACGALFIMAAAFAWTSCRWRMKLLRLQRETESKDVELKPNENADVDVFEEATAAGALPVEESPE